MQDWVLLGIVAGIGWVIAGISIFKNQLMQIQIRNFDPSEISKRLDLKETYIKDLEREIEGYREERDEALNEAKAWQGKYHQKGQIRKIPGDKYDLTQTSDLGIVAEDVIDTLSENLPGDVGSLLKDPKIKGTLIKYANEHPEESVEIIKRFIGNNTKKSTNTQSSIIPGFDFKSAI